MSVATHRYFLSISCRLVAVLRIVLGRPRFHAAGARASEYPLFPAKLDRTQSGNSNILDQDVACSYSKSLTELKKISTPWEGAFRLFSS